MWDTKIGKSIARHFTAQENEEYLQLHCLRCPYQMSMPAGNPLIYILAECIHHLQAAHGFGGDTWQLAGYLDALPDPENPS